MAMKEKWTAEKLVIEIDRNDKQGMVDAVVFLQQDVIPLMGKKDMAEEAARKVEEAKRREAAAKALKPTEQGK